MFLQFLETISDLLKLLKEGPEGAELDRIWQQTFLIRREKGKENGPFWLFLEYAITSTDKAPALVIIFPINTLK